MSDQTQTHTERGPTNGLHDESRTDQAQQAAQEAAGQAKAQAHEVAGKAQDRARQLVDERSTQAGEQLSSQAGDLRSVGEQLRSQGNDAPARIADQAAERVERLGGYLTQSDADRILSDVEDLARRNPWAVALGGVALGFAASRFLKASSRQRYETRSTQPAPRGALGPPSERHGVGTQPGPPPESPVKPAAAPAPGLSSSPVGTA